MYDDVCTLLSLDAPEIIVPPDNTIVINGSEAVFNCTVVGDPLPSISWFDEQGRINDSLVINVILNNTEILSTLRLNETAPSIAGDYTCRASNGLGYINRTATLILFGK